MDTTHNLNMDHIRKFQSPSIEEVAVIKTKQRNDRVRPVQTYITEVITQKKYGRGKYIYFLNIVNLGGSRPWWLFLSLGGS